MLDRSCKIRIATSKNALLIQKSTNSNRNACLINEIRHTHIRTLVWMEARVSSVNIGRHSSVSKRFHHIFLYIFSNGIYRPLTSQFILYYQMGPAMSLLSCLWRLLLLSEHQKIFYSASMRMRGYFWVLTTQYKEKSSLSVCLLWKFLSCSLISYCSPNYIFNYK